MNKQTKIDAIERRILDEHRKYFQHDSPVEWAKIAAIKIYSMFEDLNTIRRNGAIEFDLLKTPFEDSDAEGVLSFKPD